MANWRGSVSYPRGRCELGVKVSKLWGSQNPTQSDGATAGERELRSGGCSPFYTTVFDLLFYLASGCGWWEVGGGVEVLQFSCKLFWLEMVFRTLQCTTTQQSTY
jgi:hypothetical protein